MRHAGADRNGMTMSRTCGYTIAWIGERNTKMDKPDTIELRAVTMFEKYEWVSVMASIENRHFEGPCEAMVDPDSGRLIVKRDGELFCWNAHAWDWVAGKPVPSEDNGNG